MAALEPLPTGTVTFLFTDIEGSTRLWEEHPPTMREALARHDALLTGAIEQHGGSVVKSRGEGDSFFAVFARATDALAAAMALQQSLLAEPWPPQTPLRVRLAVHTGEAELRGGDYYGAAVSRCARLRAAGHGGQALLSLATQELVRDHLPDGVALRDLGQRRLKDLVRPEHVFQLLHPALPAEFPPLRTLDARPNNLPAQPTPLIGREREVAAVRGLLQGETAGRLLTLMGPGGTGKTRLGLQVAADLLDDFPDGVFFVALAPITDAGLVAATIAQTVGVREVGGQLLAETLKEYLRARQVLLVLDNFEQVLPAAPLLAELLAVAPGLKLLVTSRAPLRLRGEQEFLVPPLPVPDPQRLPPLAALSQYGAVELFIQQALSVRPDFVVTNENAPAVAEICARLDGLPLAIELAAVRIRLLAPQAMLARLESRLKLLTGGARDLPARQQTLRNTIAWSYDLLGAEEQKLFRWLSVFAGGCTLEAVEAVCTGDGDLDVDALGGLSALVEQSLLQQEAGEARFGREADSAGSRALGETAEPRFSMLETIREYGQECLAASGEAEAVRREHARFFLALAEKAEPQLKGGPEQEMWLERLEREHDNLRAALEWCNTDAEDPHGGLRFAATLLLFWDLHSHLTEGRQHAARALSRELGRTAERMRALHTAGHLALRQLDYPVARAAGEESLAIARGLDNRGAVAASLGVLGGVFAETGEFEKARALQEGSLAIWREMGAAHRAAAQLNNLGLTAVYQKQFTEARALLEESLAMARELGKRTLTSGMLNNLGMAALGQQDWAGAQSLFTESLRIKWELGMRAGCAWGLEGLAAVSAARSRPERAARLFGAADALRDAEGHLANAPVRELYHPYQAAARAQLGEAAFAAAWAEGRATPLQQIVEYALQPEGTSAGE